MIKFNELKNVYFLSEDSSYTTGSTIQVDGGWTAW